MSEDAVLIEYPVQKRSEEVLQWDLMRSEVESVSSSPLKPLPITISLESTLSVIHPQIGYFT
jgi:hypothetical protein